MSVQKATEIIETNRVHQCICFLPCGHIPNSESKVENMSIISNKNAPKAQEITILSKNASISTMLGRNGA